MVSKRGCCFRNARARNTHVEANLNLSFAAQVAFLAERDGALLAVSEGNITDGDGNRLNAVDSTTPLIAAAAAHAASFGPADAVVTVDDGGVEAKYWYHTALVEDDKGLAWNLTELVRIDCGTDYYLDEANLLCRKCAYPARIELVLAARLKHEAVHST